MSKRILVALIIALTIGCVMNIQAAETVPEEYSSMEENAYELIIEEGVLTGYTGTPVDVVIPSGVTTIGRYAFYECKSLTSIEIPSSVTIIEEGAFGRCSSLTSIEIPSSVTIIESYVFDECSSLTSIEIPSSVTTIEYGAFNNTPWYEQMCIDHRLVIVNNTLIKASTVGDVADIPEGVTTIHPYAFYELDSSLKKVVIPSTVTTIGYGAFYRCTFLKSVKIPEGVTTIEEDTFYACKYLSSVEIPSSVTTIGVDAFTGTQWIKDKYPLAVVNNILIDGTTSSGDVEIPEGVTKINTSAFAGNKWLTSVVIPSSVTTIGDGAFNSCQQLRRVEIPSSVTTIGDKAFYGTDLRSLKIPSGVTTIGDKAFGYCTGLNYIEIPSSVTSIGQDAFEGASSYSRKFIVERGSYAESYVKEIWNNYEYVKEDINDATITVSDTNYTYDGKAKEPEIKVEFKGYTLVEDKDYFVVYKDNQNVGTAKAVIYGIGDFFGTIERNFTINVADINEATISLSTTNYTYDGKAKEPDVKVGLNGNILEKDKDYVVSYKNNQNIGTATITITGIGGCAGTIERSFEIEAAEITNAEVSLSIISYTYDGKAKEPGVKVELNGNILEKDKDYLITYSNNIKAGSATVTITGIGNYLGTVNKSFTIKVASVSSAKVSLSTTSYTYDGKAKEPGVKVELNGNILEKDKDYSVTYKNNTKSGSATVTITGMGNYAGTINKTYTINAVSLSFAKVSLSTTSYTYDSKVKKPEVEVELNGNILEKDKDYSVTYKNNIESGSATVTITGIGNYLGIVNKTFTIKKVALSNAKVTLSKTSYNYDGKAKKPGVKSVVLANVILKNGIDYKVTYKNNVKSGTASVTIEGIGNYLGIVSKNFTIKVKTGTAFTSGGYKYKVTGTSAVEFVGLKSTSRTKVVIPATVKYAGKTFKVTSIASKALKGKTKVTSVTIGAKVTKIGASAFEGCKKLKTIKISSTVLKTVGKKAFKSINSKATIKVPKSKLTKYKTVLKNKGQGSKVKIK